MTGADGKCPLKKGSLMVTFLSATIRRSGSTSMTRSTRRKGYRCGRIRMISAMRSSMENESRRLRGLRGWRAIKTVDARHPRNPRNLRLILLLSGFGWFRRSRLAGFGIHTADNLSSDVRDILIVVHAIQLGGSLIDLFAQVGLRRVVQHFFLRPELGLGVVQ